MKLTDISELREAASGYLWLLQHYDWGYNEPNNESVTRLHKAISNVNLDKIGSVLTPNNVNQYLIIEELVDPTLKIIGKLEREIGDNMHKIINDVDPEVGKVFKFCQAMGVVLRGEYEKLQSRRFTDPTFADVDAVKNLRLFSFGSYGEMSFDDFIKEYIIKGLSPIATVRRLKYIISQSDDEHTQWGLRKFLYWGNCNEDVIRELHDAFVDFYRFYDHAADVSPIPSDGNRNDVTTRLFSVLEWCKQHDNELQTQLDNRPLLKDVEDLSVLATHICESADNWCSVIGNDAVTLELINDVAMMLDDVIAPTIKRRNPTREAQPSPSVQATAKDDAALPDFPHMESYAPTMLFDMSALYTFLIEEKVIKNIDEQLFSNCITHANMNELWEVSRKLRKRNQLRCVIRYLKDIFGHDWLACVINNGLPENIMSFNRETMGDFENKVRNLLL